MEITLLFVGLALGCSALVAIHDTIEKYGPRLFTAAKRRLAHLPPLRHMPLLARLRHWRRAPE